MAIPEKYSLWTKQRNRTKEQQLQRQQQRQLQRNRTRAAMNAIKKIDVVQFIEDLYSELSDATADETTDETTDELSDATADNRTFFLKYGQDVFTKDALELLAQ